MNRPGALLDTGPLVALLSRTDAHHDRAKALFETHAPPFRTSEAVLAEAAHLLSKEKADGPADIVTLGASGFLSVALRIDEQWSVLQRLLVKYRDVPASLADACLIRCAEIHHEPRILTFDDGFRVYRWAGRQRFEIQG